MFDQNGKRNSDGTPYRYPAAKASPKDDSWIANLPSNATCTSDSSTTSGNTLYSGTHITSQKSCKPNTLNAGNFYNFPAATTGSSNASVSSNTEVPNSICPKGWRLPPNSGNKSFNTLIRTAYSLTATNSDSTLLNNSAMSFVRLGNYDYIYGTLYNRGYAGYYWSSTAYSSVGRLLHFNSGGLSPQVDTSRADGLSIRCVSR